MAVRKGLDPRAAVPGRGDSGQTLHRVAVRTLGELITSPLPGLSNGFELDVLVEGVMSLQKLFFLTFQKLCSALFLLCLSLLSKVLNDP